MIKHVTEFDLSREVWLRGDELESKLYRPRDGKMCCLGVYLEACGFEKVDMADIATPLMMQLGELPSWLLEGTRDISSKDVTALMRVNDERILDTETYEWYKVRGTLNAQHHADEDEREEKIIALFKKQGVTVNIVD